MSDMEELIKQIAEIIDPLGLNSFGARMKTDKILALPDIKNNPELLIQYNELCSVVFNVSESVGYCWEVGDNHEMLRRVEFLKQSPPTLPDKNVSVECPDCFGIGSELICDDNGDNCITEYCEGKCKGKGHTTEKLQWKHIDLDKLCLKEGVEFK